MIDYTELAIPEGAVERAFLDRWIGDYTLAALTASDALGLFEALASAPSSARELAERLQLVENALWPTCRVLVGLGYVSENAGVFSLSAPGALLWVPGAPGYRGREYHRHDAAWAHQRVVETLEAGWSPLSQENEVLSTSWETGHLSSRTAHDFSQFMHSMILGPSLSMVRSGAFSGLGHLVDVGGGSGALAAALVAHQPMSRATVLDLPETCEASREIVHDVMGSERVDYFPCNFFRDAWPDDADAFSFSNILHDWPVPKGRELLSHAFDSLPSKGRIFLHEALLDEDRATPLFTAVFSLLMRINHQAQQFTLSDLESLLAETGFTNPRVVHEYGYYSLIEAVKP